MYCTIEDIKTALPEERIVELTDDSDEPITIISSIVNGIIAYSDSIIDGFLRGKLNLPLSPVPELIKIYSVDICCYRLYSRRPDVEMPEGIKINYENALKFLEKIQKGTFQIEGTIQNQPSPYAGEYKTNKTSADRIFNNEMWEKY